MNLHIPTLSEWLLTDQVRRNSPRPAKVVVPRPYEPHNPQLSTIALGPKFKRVRGHWGP